MSAPERVYTLLVDANPVPDPDELLVASDLRDTMPRRHTMQTETPIVRPLEPSPSPPARPWIAAIAAAVVAIAAVAGALLWLGGGDDEGPAVEPESSARAADAVARVEAVYEALDAGDVATVAGLLSPDQPLELDQTRLWEFNVVYEEAYPTRRDGCAAISLDNDLFVLVECAAVDTSPVAGALGGGERVDPWRVFDDGRIDWLPWKSATLGDGAAELDAAFAAYLAVVHEDEYWAVCSASAYEALSVIVNQRIALTPECAELMVATAPDVAAWIEQGRPELTPTEG